MTRRAAGPANTSAATSAATPATTSATALALVADVAVVLLFAAVGRRSHGEAGALVGLAHTAWPFLAGLALGWLVVALRRWHPLTVVPAGLAVWACALVGGHLLRLASGQGSAWSFVVVSAVVLALLLLGWRALSRPLARLLGSGRASGYGPRGQD